MTHKEQVGQPFVSTTVLPGMKAPLAEQAKANLDAFERCAGHTTNTDVKRRKAGCACKAEQTTPSYCGGHQIRPIGNVEEDVEIRFGCNCTRYPLRNRTVHPIFMRQHPDGSIWMLGLVIEPDGDRKTLEFPISRGPVDPPYRFHGGPVMSLKGVLPAGYTYGTDGKTIEKLPEYAFGKYLIPSCAKHDGRRCIVVGCIVSSADDHHRPYPISRRAVSA